MSNVYAPSATDLRAQLLAAKPTKTERVNLDLGDGQSLIVWVREMSLGERDAFEAGQMERDGTTFTMKTEGLKARLIVLCTCHEDGSRVFSDKDFSALLEVGSSVIEPLFTACQRVNGMIDDEDSEDDPFLDSQQSEGSDFA